LKSIRDLVSQKVIAVDYVGTKDNTADPLTKGLELALVLKFRLGMGLNPIKFIRSSNLTYLSGDPTKKVQWVITSCGVDWNTRTD
jgi:hypothetical protein